MQVLMRMLCSTPHPIVGAELVEGERYSLEAPVARMLVATGQATPDVEANKDRIDAFELLEELVDMEAQRAEAERQVRLALEREANGEPAPVAEPEPAPAPVTEEE